MSDQTKTPWAQTTGGVLVVQGLIGPVISAVVGVVLTLVVTQPDKVDGLALAALGLGVAIVAFLLISFFAPKLRSLTWGNVLKFIKWIAGVRPTTRSAREAAHRAGYDKRSAEVAGERTHSPRPTWRVSHRDGDDFVYIHNSGYWVQDVVVRADPALFEFADGASEGFIKGKLGDNAPGGSSGKQVSGRLTREGERQGVTFELSWVDQHGDSQPETAGAHMPSGATLAPKPLKPLTQPAWQIGRPRAKASAEVLMLANGAEGFVGTDVIINADPNYFTFILKRELGDLTGIGGLRFAGRPTDGGRVLGVDFFVTYKDVNGDEHTDHVPAKFDFGYGF